MSLDPTGYTHLISYIEEWLDARPDEKPIDQIGLIALATGLHILLVTHYVGEYIGWSEELKEYRNKLEKFYKEKVNQ